MYIITNYADLYNPTNSKGGQLINAVFVKWPVNPRGKGLRALLKYDRGLEILGVWGLLLQAATETTKPDLRGKLLNHKDEPASIEEIADSISLESDIDIVKISLSALVEMGWMTSVQDTDLVRTPSVQDTDTLPPKVKKREDKISKAKGEDFSFTAIQPDFFKNLFAETFKPETTFEVNTFNKLGGRCYKAMSQLENPNYHRYIIDELEDLKLACREKKKSREDFIRMFTSKIRKELDKYGVE